MNQLKEKTWYVQEGKNRIYIIGKTPKECREQHWFGVDESGSGWHFNDDGTHKHGCKSFNLISEYIEPPTALELATYFRKEWNEPLDSYGSPAVRTMVRMADAIIAAAK